MIKKSIKLSILLIIEVILICLLIVYIDNKRIENYCLKANTIEGITECAIRQKKLSPVDYFFDKIVNINFDISKNILLISEFFIQNNLNMNMQQKKILINKLDQCIIKKSLNQENCDTVLRRLKVYNYL